jgi:hypothetical protein
VREAGTFVSAVAGGAVAARRLGAGGRGGRLGPRHHEPRLDGDEIYQLIKRGEINPHEVEEVGSHAVEVSVMWKSAILHVAHLRDSQNFVLSGKEPEKKPRRKVMRRPLGRRHLLMMLVGAAKSDPQHARDQQRRS